MHVAIALVRVPPPRLRRIYQESVRKKVGFVRLATAEALGKAPEALTSAEYQGGLRALSFFLEQQ